MEEKFMNLKEELVMTVGYDDCPESPREWDNMGTFYTWQRNRISPDENNFSDAIEFISSILGESATEKIHEKYNNTADFMSEIVQKLDKRGYVLYPVSAYEHGDIVFSLGCESGWDSGTIGVIFAEKKKIYEEFGVKRLTKEIREKIENIFTSELATYTQWANGEVYIFSLEKLNGDHVDCVGGVYDEIMYSVQSAYLYTKDYADIGKLSDWEEFDEEKLSEAFEVSTVARK